MAKGKQRIDAVPHARRGEDVVPLEYFGETDADPPRNTAADAIRNATRSPSPPTQSKPKHEFEGHEDQIWSFIFLHDNKHIVSSSSDGTMRKWDCHTGLLVGEPWKGKGRKIWALALSPDGMTIACGRDDGSVQQWNTEGKMIKGVWRHRNAVRSVSWSPNGGHIASGSDDGTILIRKAENRQVEVGPIKTGQGRVRSLAYSPSGNRIASGGDNAICIWDSETGKLLVGPIKNLGTTVTSVVWSSDSSKLYSASDRSARVFDSVSGTELHHFENDNSVYCVALSPKHDLLACVGAGGIAQLWDTKSYKPLDKLFSTKDSSDLNYVSFSRDGRYLAYGGNDKSITLWVVGDIAPQFALPAPTTQEGTLQEPGQSYLDVDATNPFGRPGGDGIEDGHNNPYDGFFQSSHSSLHLSSSSTSSTRQLWGAFVVASVFRTPANECLQLTKRFKPRFLTRHARSPASPSEASANNEPTGPTPDGKMRAEREHNEVVDDYQCSANMMPGAAEQNEGTQQDLSDPETLPPDDASSTTEFDTNENSTFWKFLRTRGKNATTSPAQMTHSRSLNVVDISACRKQLVYVASDDLPDSDLIQGSWNKFLYMICFPCGHHEDD